MRAAKKVRAHRWGWESLESRVALSRAGGFGAVGDSLTDEYRFYPPDRSHARNWVETLATQRKVNFGAYTTRDRGLPRDQGYANNWARQEATTSDVVSTQLPGLARQVASGKVTYVAVAMGTNDYLYFAQSVAAAALSGVPPTGLARPLATLTSTAAANVQATVDTILEANPRAKVVLATSPDIRQVPLVVQFQGLPGVDRVASAIASAQESYNNFVRSIAANNPRVALADIASLAKSYPGATETTLPIGGVKVRLKTTGDDYRDAILADKIHPGTVLQGLIANTITRAANTLGAKIKPLTPLQIVRRARFVANNFRTAR